MRARLADGIRRRWSLLQEEREAGRAIVEFIMLGILLIVPLVYLVFTVARIQAASFAVTNASREAARIMSATLTGDARGKAEYAADLALRDFGFDKGGTLQISCSPACGTPDGTVTVTATYVVPLPLVPDIFVGHVPASVTISSTQVGTFDRFRGRR